MSVSLNATAYSSKESKEFQKHYNAVKFCIENELSFPKETSDFFKGKIGGDNLEDVKPEAIIKHIENGVSKESAWNKLFSEYSSKYPELAKEYAEHLNKSGTMASLNKWIWEVKIEK